MNQSNYNERKKSISIIIIHSTLMEEAQSMEVEGSSILQTDISNLNSAASAEDQITRLRVMAKTYLEKEHNQNTQLSQFFIKLLVELYVCAELKNPLKSAIARILSTICQEMHESIVTALTLRLNKHMADARNTNVLLSTNFAVNTIIGCFNNFSLGERSVILNLDSTLKFLNDCLQTYTVELRSDLSPAKKMEVYQYVHCTTRAIVTVLQKCQMNIKIADFVLEDAKQGECKQKCIDILPCMLQFISILQTHHDLPMDTKSNCGFIIVMLTILIEGDAGWHSLLYKNLEIPLEQPGTYSLLDLSSDMSRLYIFCGLLNAIPIEKLCCTTPRSNKIVIQILFHQFLAIGKRNTSDSGIVLAVSRALLLLSRCLCGIGEKTFAPSHSISDLGIGIVAKSDIKASSIEVVLKMAELMLDDGLHFIWTHLEHYMDSVRHTARNMLRNFVVLGVHLKKSGSDRTKLLDAITEAAISIPPYRKCRYIALATLASEVGCKALLTYVPDLVPSLLTAVGDAAVTTHVASTFEMLMLTHQAECTSEVWRAVWLDPLMNTLIYSTPDTCVVLENMLAKVVCKHPVTITYILEAVGVAGEATPSCEQLCTLLTCLKIGHKHGAFDKLQPSSDDNWKGVLRYNVLEEALCHRQDKIRLAALTLIAVSRRSTEPLSSTELQLVRSFLKHNLNTQTAAMRQQILTLLKKILVRMKDSSLVHEKRMNASTDQLHSYTSFLLWLIDFSFINLFPGANFGRRGSALKMLTLCVEIFDTDTPACMWTHANSNILLDCLKDTYENNKQLALNLLLKFPETILGLHDKEFVASHLSVSMKLISSNRPADCATAAYLLRTVVGFPQSATVRACILDLQRSKNISITDEMDIPQQLVALLLHQLEAELDIAKKSLLRAAAGGPMYGLLFCIRHVLLDVGLGKASQHASWRVIITRLIAVCFEISAAVAPVVNNSSPEGHLPMDLDPGIYHIQDCSASEENVSNGNAEPSILNVTAQMVLLCSWKSIKEVSLFLGELSECAPIMTLSSEGDDEPSLLTEKQLLKIGEHFTHLLANTKHRGAFEQAYVGFCKLCSRLWQYRDGRLHRLPAEWLQNLLDAVSSGGGVKFCVTRRSAGVPFMVQALVTTELQVGGSLQCFQQSMFMLLKLAGTGSSLEARTHAFNILRALYRHNQLGEQVAPYVADGVAVAVHGFKGNSWAERNSATLLFSALMTRIFGVSRSRTGLSMRNRMTGRIFFHRYPSLFDFFLEELNASTSTWVSHMEFSSNMGLQSSLFPVLLVLARLYPSSLEGTDSNLQLSAYIPYVHACARCPVLKTRDLAARALVPLITPNLYVQQLDQLFCIVSDTGNVERNYRQGVLLQIIHLLEELPIMLNLNEALKDKINLWLIQSKWLLNSSKHSCADFLTSETYLQMMQKCLDTCFTIVSEDYWSEIRDLLAEDLMKKSDEQMSKSYDIGKSIYDLRSAQVLLTISLNISQKQGYSKLVTDVESLMANLLSHPNYEVILMALNFICCLFEGNMISEEKEGNDEEEDEEDDDDFAINSINLNCLENINKNLKNILKESIKASIRILEILMRLVTDKNIYSKCCQYTFHVLYHIPEAIFQFYEFNATNEDVLKWLLKVYKEKHESTSYAVLKCVDACLSWIMKRNSKVMLSDVFVDELCQVLLKSTSAEKSPLIRLSVARLLLNNNYLLSGSVSFISILNVCTLWTTVLTLLDDDDLIVRNMVSRLADDEGARMPTMANKAREVLVERFTLTVSQLDPTVCAACLLAWSLGEVEEKCTVGEVSEDQIFNKGNINIFAEDIMVTELACNNLRLILEKEGIAILETNLKDDVRHWMCLHCWPGGCTSQDNFFSLQEFIKMTVMKIYPLGDMQVECAIGRASHFLISEHNFILAMYKIRKILDVIPFSL